MNIIGNKLFFYKNGKEGEISTVQVIKVTENDIYIKTKNGKKYKGSKELIGKTVFTTMSQLRNRYGNEFYYPENSEKSLLSASIAASRKEDGLYFEKASRKRNGFIGGSDEWDSWDFA